MQSLALKSEYSMTLLHNRVQPVVNPFQFPPDQTKVAVLLLQTLFTIGSFCVCLAPHL